MERWTSANWRLIMRAAANGELNDTEIADILRIVAEHRGVVGLPATSDWVRGYCDALITWKLLRNNV